MPTPALMDVLESRRLFAVTVAKTLAPITVPAGAPVRTIPLSGVFLTDNLTGPVVRFTTALNGVSRTLDVELFSKPLTTTTGTGTNAVTSTRTAALDTVTNFLKYVDAGDYNNSLVHRAANFSGTSASGTGGTDLTTQPAVALYGGQFTTTGLAGELTPIPSRGQISGEFAADRPSSRGTLAMFRASPTDRATSSFFFNVADNSSLFDSNSRFTNFGRVLSTGTTVLDSYAALPRSTVTASVTATGTRTLPSVPQSNTAAGLADTNLVKITSVARVSSPAKSFTYSATSSTAQVVATSVTATGALQLTYLKAGTSTITLTATDLTGATQRTTFNVTVRPPLANLTFNGKPVLDGQLPAVNLGATFQNQPTTRSLKLTNSGAGQMTLGTPILPEGYTLASALPSTLAPGKSLTLTLNIDTSAPITRTVTLSIPTDGVLDGTFSFPVSLTVANTLTLGPASPQGIKTVVYTDADGTQTTLSLTAGTASTAEARLLFSGSGLAVTTTPAGRAVVTGDAISLTSITLANTNATTTFSVTPVGGADNAATLATLTSQAPLKSANLRNINVLTALTFDGGLSSLTVGDLNNTSLIVTGPLANLTARDVTASTVTVSGTLTKATLRTLSSSVLKIGTTSNQPTSALDFIQTSQLTSLTLTAPAPMNAFLSSSIFARAIGTLSVGMINVDEGSGSVVRTFAIARLTGKDPSRKSFSIKNIGTDVLDPAAELNRLGIATSRLDVIVL